MTSRFHDVLSVVFAAETAMSHYRARLFLMLLVLVFSRDKLEQFDEMSEVFSEEDNQAKVRALLKKVRFPCR